MATSTRSANQPPPLAGYNLYEQDAALVESVRREGGAAWEEELAAFGATAGGEPLEWGRLANEHPPTLRRFDRYGERVDEIEFHPAWDSLLRLARDARVQSLPWVDDRRARTWRGGAVHAARPGRGGRLLSDLDDLRGRPRPARGARPRLRVDSAADERRGAVRDGDDRAAGRLGRACERDHGPPGGRPLAARRAQVVLLRADERRLPRARAGPRRPLLLPARAGPARLPGRAAEGQARQPLERLGRDRARRRRRPARRRGGPRRPDDRRDGQPHPPRLRARLDRAPAPRRRGGDASRRAPGRVRPPARRAAADAERARRPLCRVRGRDRHRAPAGASLRRGRRAVPPAGHRRREVLDLQADAAPRRGGARVPRRERLRRGIAAAAALPREPRQLDLGGLRQRERARRAPRAGAGAGDRRGVSRGGAPRRRSRRGSMRRSSGSRTRSTSRRRRRARRLLELLAVTLQGSLLVRHGDPEVAAPSVPPPRPARAASTERCPPVSTWPRSSSATGRSV